MPALFRVSGNKRVVISSFAWLSCGLSLAAAALLFSATVNAQTVPSYCRPNSGAQNDCAIKFMSHYVYIAGICGGPNANQPTEAAAHGAFEESLSGSECPVTIIPLGWISPGSPKTIPQDFIVACGGSGTYPAMAYGQDTTNWFLDEVTTTSPPPTCENSQETIRGAVRRERTLRCPDGYSHSTANMCSRGFANRDHAKNYGSSCPPKGQCLTENPINISAANKFRAESDYRAGGDSPLAFVRYYNSFPGNSGFVGHYHDPNFELHAGQGTNGYAYSSAEPSELTGRYEVLALGAVGVAWRHSYQRVIVRETSALITTAYAFRQDGRVLTFTKMSGQWYSHADIPDRLQEIVDGGGIQTGWKLALSEDSTETFDLTGRLLSIRSRSGLEETLSYDGCGRLGTVTDSFGHSLSLTYSTSCAPFNPQRLATLTVPGGGTFQYAYDSAGRLTSVTDPAGETRQYHYENSSYPLALTGITDESAQRYATFGYDAGGRPNLSELAGGADRVSVAYWGTSIVTPQATVTMPLGATATYNFVTKQGVSKVSTQSAYCEGCPLNAKSMTYDANGNITIRKDFNNRETRYSYDLARNLETSRTEAYGTPKARTITTQWHATFRLPTQTDEPSRRTTFTHDASGNVLTRTVTDLSVTPNVSRTWTFTYNGFGQELTADGPRTDVSDVTTYAYYSCSTGFQCGQLQSVTNAASHVTTYNTYNAHGQPLTITDPNGLITTLTYDARQRVTSRAAGGETTSFEYWPTGLLKKVTLPDLSFIQYTYDAAHRLTQVSDSEGDRIVYTLDAAGNRIKEETFDPSNFLVRLHHRAFNTLNQLWKEIGAANTAAVTTTFGYDPNGNQTSASAPLGRNTASLYDELNRLKQITDAASGITLFGYDANDNLTSVTDPRGKVTSYVYNGFGDLKQQTSPDTGVTDNVYDSGGNLSTSTDARSKTGTYSYDALNRVTQLSYPDQTMTYTYDTGTNNKGRLMQVSDASGSTTWTYSTLGRVASRTQSMGVSKNVGYGYNSAGQLTTLTTPSGQTITYGYTNNRITSITVNSTTLLNGVLYDPFGPARQWTWGNSTLAVRSFDQDGNVDQLDSAGLRTYAQDDAFRITGITDAVNPNLSWTLAYDLLDRLTSASKTGQSQTWTYDANSNRLTQGGTSSSTFTISGTNNQLSSVSGALSRTYGYDAAGNTTSYGGFTFSYNDAGRMTGVSGPATASYAHNALGQRVKKVAGGVTTYFVFDEAGHLLGEYDGAGALIQETIWLEDIPVATLRPNGGSVSIFYVHADHLNTPRRITRPSDSVIVWRWDSDPFGTDAANQDPDGDSNQFAYNLRFPGQYFDAETGLSYNYRRDYDPQVGRYVQSDPIGLRGGINTYSYVAGNPLSYFDPDGLRARVCCRLIPFVGVVGARHCYIERDMNGQSTTWGLIGDRGGPRSRAGEIYIDNAFDDGGSCGPWTDECNTDECVAAAANAYPNPSTYRFARGPNSNTFAGTVARECNLRRPNVFLTPGWDDPPADQRPGVPYRPPTDLSP